MLTAEQHAIRSTGIGSSDIAAVVGVHPYRSPHEVWLQKRGLVAPSPETDETWLGHQMEAVIALRYAQETGAELVMGPGTVAHPEHPWVLATTDRERVDGSRIVECKWVGQRVAWHWVLEDDGVPQYVMAQVQWQMLARNIDRCDVAVIFGGTAGFRIYALKRNERIIAGLLRLAGEFWQDRVLAGVPPPIDGSDAAREALRALYPANRKPLKPAPPEAAEWFAKRIDAHERMLTAEADKSMAGNKLIELIGEADGIVGDFGLVTYKATKAGNRTLRVVQKDEKAA